MADRQCSELSESPSRHSFGESEERKVQSEEESTSNSTHREPKGDLSVTKKNGMRIGEATTNQTDQIKFEVPSGDSYLEALNKSIGTENSSGHSSVDLESDRINEKVAEDKITKSFSDLESAKTDLKDQGGGNSDVMNDSYHMKSFNEITCNKVEIVPQMKADGSLDDTGGDDRNIEKSEDNTPLKQPGAPPSKDVPKSTRSDSTNDASNLASGFKSLKLDESGERLVRFERPSGCYDASKTAKKLVEKPVAPELISLFLVRKNEKVRMVRFCHETGVYDVYVDCSGTTWKDRQQELEDHFKTSLKVRHHPAAKFRKLNRLCGSQPLCSYGCLQIFTARGETRNGMVTLFIENMDTGEKFMLIMAHLLENLQLLRDKVDENLYEQVFSFKSPTQTWDELYKMFMEKLNILLENDELKIEVKLGPSEQSEVVLKGDKIVGFCFDDVYSLYEFTSKKDVEPPNGTSCQYSSCDAMLVKIMEVKTCSACHTGSFEIGPGADQVFPIHEIFPVDSLTGHVLSELSEHRVISDNQEMEVRCVDTVRQVDPIHPHYVHKKTITTTTKKGWHRVFQESQSGMGAVIKDEGTGKLLSSLAALGSSDSDLKENYYHPVLQQLKRMTYLEDYDVQRCDIRYKLPMRCERLLFRHEKNDDSGYYTSVQNA